MKHYLLIFTILLSEFSLLAQTPTISSLVIKGSSFIFFNFLTIRKLTFTLFFSLFFFLFLLSNSTIAQNCSTPSSRSMPTILLGSGSTSSGDANTWYLGPGYTKSFYMNSNTFFVIESVTPGRSIRISTCGCGYDSQITLRDWSTDTFLAYNNDG
jgi:hypothetical protein